MVLIEVEITVKPNLFAEQFGGPFFVALPIA